MTNPTCADCQFFVPPSPGERHGQCHAPVPMWVHAEFNYVPGAVDHDFPASKCALFAAAAHASSGAHSRTAEPDSARSPQKRIALAAEKRGVDGGGRSQA